MSITIYSKENCSQCRMLANILDSKGIDYEEKKLDEHYTLDELMESFDQLEQPRPKQFPIVFVGSEYVGGLTETKRLIMQGKLS